MSWTPPDAKTADPQIQLTQDARLAMQKWMRMALAEADCARQRGSAPNAAVIVDPATGMPQHSPLLLTFMTRHVVCIHLQTVSDPVRESILHSISFYGLVPKFRI